MSDRPDKFLAAVFVILIILFIISYRAFSARPEFANATSNPGNDNPVFSTVGVKEPKK